MKPDKLSKKLGIHIDLQYKPSPLQLEAHLCNEPIILFGGSVCSGKELSLTTPILTEHGWKPMGDIHVGDKVFDQAGNLVTVLRESKVSTSGVRYKLIFNNGAEEVFACADHQWLVRDVRNRVQCTNRTDEFRAKRRAKRPYRGTGKRRDLMVANAEREYKYKEPPEQFVRTTQQLFETKHVKIGKNSKGANYTIDKAKPLQFPEKEQIVPAYALGAFLGDGCVATAYICGYDYPVYDRIASYGYDIQEHKNPCVRGFKGLALDLKKIGVLNDKHIPKEYLFGSYQQRLELIQGIMDTDGCISKKGACEFSSCIKQLSNDLCFLLRSIGVSCNVRTNEAFSYNNGKKKCKDRHRIAFTTTLPVFTLPRHLARLPKKIDKKHLRHTITDIIPVPSVPMKCIEVDSPSHTYLCSKSLIPTHNSVWGVNDMLQSCLDYAENRVGIYRWENTIFEQSTMKTINEWILNVKNLVKAHNQTKREITLCNNSVIHYGGLKPSSTAAGDLLATIKSLEVSCAFVDEVSDVPEEVFEFLMGRVGRWRGVDNKTGKRIYVPKRLICSSNPVPGWVKKRFIDQDLEGHAFIGAKTADNPFMDKSYLADLRKRWSPEKVKQLLEGDWDTVGETECVFPYTYLQAAVAYEYKPKETDVVELACDVATYGGDATVICKRKGFKGEILEVIKKCDSMYIAERLAYYNAIYHPQAVKVDGVGNGEGVCSRLFQLEVPCVPVIGQAAAFDTDHFVNLRAEMHWHLRTLLQRGWVDLPDNIDLINEMGCIRFSDNPGKIQIESKKKLRARIGKSPDYTDAFIYLFSDAGSPYTIGGLL